MPTPSADNLEQSPSAARQDASRGAFSALRLSEHIDGAEPRRPATDHDDSRALSREADCAVDTKAEELTGVPTPPPSEPETEASLPRRIVAHDRNSSQSAAVGGAKQDDPAAHRTLDALSVSARTAESTKENDSGSVRPSHAASLATSAPPPQYLYLPELERDRIDKSTISFLRPGSKFVGTQTSDRQRYEVQVEIKDVDLDESYLCGYLRIQGLTDDHPTLTTFFGGEIIGPKYKFKTTHESWGSNEKNDMTHWACFPDWRKLAKPHRSPNFTAPDHLQREHLYMRWKEYFLVPDHRVKTIAGASFEGFYYICFNQCSGCVDGVYFHAKSEKWQQLRLEHVNDRGCAAAVEFR